MKKIPMHRSQNKTKIFIPINKIMTNTSRLSILYAWNPSVNYLNKFLIIIIIVMVESRFIAYVKIKIN